MRFIDIDRLELPDGWKERADEALNELRSEITTAEAAALAAGQDPVAARKAAITVGLNIENRKKIWRDLEPRLAALANNKCWYSESRNPMADKDVDHFRPKNRVEEDPLHEGYWWLSFAWRNYRYSSQWCNQRRSKKSYGTEGGKWDHFPICSGGYRAYQEWDDTDLEEPDLLDPIDPEDWKLLTFRPDGLPIPAKQPGTREYDRADASIKLYHLHYKELVTDRRILAGTVQRIVQDLEMLRPRIIDLKMRTLYKRREVELLRAIHPDNEYSAAALAYSRAEIYKNEHGRQVKREWLEEILNSHA